jgi:hypothetical protein
MKRKVGRKRKGAKQFFLLPHILPMRPYLLSLMSDLRACHIRQHRLRSILSAPSTSSRDYAERRKRSDASEQLQKVT